MLIRAPETKSTCVISPISSFFSESMQLRAGDEVSTTTDSSDDDDDDEEEDLAVIIVGSAMGGVVLVVLTGYIVVRARGGCVPR